MRRMTVTLTGWTLAAVVAAGTWLGPARAGESGLTADEVVAKTGIAGGLCSFPRATPADEKLALELAKRPAFVVHLRSRDARVAARVREAAEAAGVLGRSLYVEEGPGAPLPFADRLVDLLVAGDLADADLTPELRREWLRVLSPGRGTALVGRAASAGAGLKLEALQAWSKDQPQAKVASETSGLWAVFKAALPAGSDAWSHRYHGPEASQVSSDGTLKAPFLTQWWGLPRQEGFWGTTVLAGGGRMFTVRGSRRPTDEVFLTARSLTNGLVLWQKRLRPASETEKALHGGFIPGRSCAALAGEVLYLTDKDGVLRLAAETGKELDRIAGPRPGGQVKWLAAADGVLAVLSGEADAVRPIAYQTIATNSLGRELAAYDGESKKELWRETLPGDVDERLLAVRDGRLYCLVQGAGVVCRELRTGKVVWTNADAALQADLLTPEPKVIDQLLVSQPTMMALEDVLVLRAKWAKNVFALSRADGSLLWKKPADPGSYRGLTALAYGGLWLGGREGPIDLKTGKPAAGPRFISSGCGPTTAVPGYLITCFGTVMDAKTNKIIRNEDIKSPCEVGSLVAEGIMLTVPSQCGCYYEVKGYRALAAAGSLQPHAAPPWKDRLTVLDAAEPAALAVTPADWPTYRHDPQRSAASAAAVGENPKLLWHWKPAGAAPYNTVWPSASSPRLAPDHLATAPVAAGGLVWFASPDGTVRCLKAADGKAVWSFPTGGMLFAPPTVWEGRLLVGGGDGRIYCLDAGTGRLLWRLAAAPADRRVFWFGHLVSTWPVVPGVAVQDGVAYAVAGYQKENGIHAYAIDPKSGQVLWEKDDAGSGGPAGPGAGLGNCGSMALSAGRLWLSSSPAGGFDLKSGDWKQVGGGNFGCETGVLDKWTLQGGRRLTETQDSFKAPLGGSGFGAWTGQPQPARVGLTDAGTSLPAWDAEFVLMAPKGLTGGLTAVPAAKLLAWMEERPAALAAAAKAPKGAPKPKLVEWADLKAWATEPVTPAAFVLAKDQAVAAVSDGRTHRVSGFLRTDGSKAWTVELPEQPAMNRMALDRDGRVLLSLCDGSVICIGR